MKRSLFSILALATFSVTTAQTKPAVVRPKPVAIVKKPANVVPMKGLIDSFSYSAGYNIAMNMKEQGITNINTALVQKALADVFGNKQIALNQDQINAALQDQLKIFSAEKEKMLVAPGIAFLAENKKRSEVTVLKDGVQYEILTPGSATGAKPTIADTVVVNYAGSLINGTEFENSFKAGHPITFTLTQVIPGWTEILQLMTVGAKWKVYIPQELAYGMHPRDPNVIPPGSALVFVMSLEDIKPVVKM